MVGFLTLSKASLKYGLGLLVSLPVVVSSPGLTPITQNIADKTISLENQKNMIFFSDRGKFYTYLVSVLGIVSYLAALS